MQTTTTNYLKARLHYTISFASCCRAYITTLYTTLYTGLQLLSIRHNSDIYTHSLEADYSRYTCIRSAATENIYFYNAGISSQAVITPSDPTQINWTKIASFLSDWQQVKFVKLSWVLVIISRDPTQLNSTQLVSWVTTAPDASWVESARAMWSRLYCHANQRNQRETMLFCTCSA